MIELLGPYTLTMSNGSGWINFTTSHTIEPGAFYGKSSGLIEALPRNSRDSAWRERPPCMMRVRITLHRGVSKDWLAPK